VANRSKEIERVENLIVPVNEAEPFLKALVYGRNGAGKTRVAATAPKPLLLVDVNEKGTKSIRTYKGVDVMPVRKWEEFIWTYWYLRSGNHKYKSVVIDNWTNLQNLCIRDVIIKEAEDRDPNRDPKTMSQRDWGKMAEFLKPEILNYRNLPMHVIYVAQMRNGKDRNDEAADDYWVPDMSPGPRAQLLAAGDIIGYVYQKEVRGVDKRTKKEVKKHEHRMLIGPHEEYITKNRVDQSLGSVVRNPNLTEIAELVPTEEDK